VIDVRSEEQDRSRLAHRRFLGGVKLWVLGLRGMGRAHDDVDVIVVGAELGRHNVHVSRRRSGDEPSGAELLGNVGEVDEAADLAVTRVATRDDECVVRVVVREDLLVVRRARVLAPHAPVVEQDLTRSEEASRSVDQLLMDGDEIRLGLEKRELPGPGPLVVTQPLEAIREGGVLLR
jgi:hypothetical protein